MFINTLSEKIKTAKFGDRFKTRDGRLALFLSIEYLGGSDEYNPPFTVVNFAIEQHVKYVDGSEKRFHSIIETNENGKFNKWNTEDDNEDIISDWEDGKDLGK